MKYNYDKERQKPGTNKHIPQSKLKIPIFYWKELLLKARWERPFTLRTWKLEENEEREKTDKGWK
jgi:hypothetical protein